MSSQTAKVAQGGASCPILLAGAQKLCEYQHCQSSVVSLASRHRRAHFVPLPLNSAEDIFFAMLITEVPGPIYGLQPGQQGMKPRSLTNFHCTDCAKLVAYEFGMTYRDNYFGL